MPTPTPNSALRLRKHADYQRVYTSSRKQFSKQMSFFYSLRPAEGPDGKARRSDTTGPRIGLTVGKVMGKAVDRNRIKRRMRECIRKHASLMTAPVDVILHPRRIVIEMEFAKLEREVAQVFRGIQAAITKTAAPGSDPVSDRNITPPSKHRAATKVVAPAAYPNPHDPTQGDPGSR